MHKQQIKTKKWYTFIIKQHEYTMCVARMILVLLVLYVADKQIAIDLAIKNMEAPKVFHFVGIFLMYWAVAPFIEYILKWNNIIYSIATENEKNDNISRHGNVQKKR